MDFPGLKSPRMPDLDPEDSNPVLFLLFVFLSPVEEPPGETFSDEVLLENPTRDLVLSAVILDEISLPLAWTRGTYRNKKHTRNTRVLVFKLISPSTFFEFSKGMSLFINHSNSYRTRQLFSTGLTVSSCKTSFKFSITFTNGLARYGHFEPGFDSTVF